MKNTAEFVTIHLNDDTTRLILDRKKYEDIGGIYPRIGVVK